MLYSIITAFLAALFMAAVSVPCCTVMQTGGYSNAEYCRWLNERGLSRYWLVLVMAIVFAGGATLSASVSAPWAVIVSYILACGFIALGYVFVADLMPLRELFSPGFSPRGARLFVLTVFMAVLCTVGAVFAGTGILAIIVAFIPIMPLIANVIMRPFEKKKEV